MLLSEWRKTAPNRESMSNKVFAALKPVLADLGADGDPSSWVLWGDDPEFRYSVLVPTPAGLIVAAVRLGGGPEGIRVTGKLVRWGKLAVGELSVESAGGHRIVATQVEGLVLKGTDEEADQICGFVRGLLAGIDGRAESQVGAPVYIAAAPPAMAPYAVPTVRVGAVPAPEPAPAPGAKPGLKAVPAPAPSKAKPDETAAAADTNQPPVRKPARTPGGKTQPAWVPPHPIGLPSRPAITPPALGSGPMPAHQPAGAKPAGPRPAQPPAPVAPARPVEPPGEAAPVWEVPAAPEAPSRDKQRPRTWTP
jgi:hypothetical protein